MCSVVCVLGAVSAPAQAPNVEIIRDGRDQRQPLIEQAKRMHEEAPLLSMERVLEQQARRACSIELAEPRTEPLQAREIWQRAKAARVRVGWLHLCTKCDTWHLSLAGGYFVSAHGAVATCFHVIDARTRAYREGYLVAANDAGQVLRVSEVLAASELTDTAIIRVELDKAVTPLPLNTETYPGDTAWCYSDPLGRSGYFSQGIINRFYVYKKNGQESARIEVSTDWAPGSSGSAVLDGFGNAIGHVSEISGAGTARRARGGRSTGSTNATRNVVNRVPAPMMVFHCASRAADVRALVDDAAAE